MLAVSDFKICINPPFARRELKPVPCGLCHKEFYADFVCIGESKKRKVPLLCELCVKFVQFILQYGNIERIFK